MKETLLRQEKIQPTHWRLLESNLTDQDIAIAQRLLIPKFLLHGTQRKTDYDNRTQKWMKDIQKQSPVGAIELLKKPVTVVGIHEHNGTKLYISDGHHRARFSRRPLIPCVVLSEDHALAIINRDNDTHLSLDEYRDYMFTRAQDALFSFSTSLPNDKFPKQIYRLESLRQLTQTPGVQSY